MDEKRKSLVILSSYTEFLPWKERYESFLCVCESKSPYHTPFWLLACWQQPQKTVHLCLLVDNHEEILAAVGFTYKWISFDFIRFPIQALQTNPTMPMHFTTDSLLLVKEGVSIDNVAWFMNEALSHFTWDTTHIPFIDLADPIFLQALEQVALKNNWGIKKEPTVELPVIDLSLGYTPYLNSRIKGIRKESFTLERHLIRNGLKISFEEELPSKMSWDVCFDKIIEIWNNTWKGESGFSPISPPYREYAYNQMQKMYNDGLLKIHFLFINDTPVAFSIAIEYMQTLHPLIIGYDKTYKKYSIGTILLRKLFEYEEMQGIDKIYLGVLWNETPGNYKRYWMNEEIKTYGILLYKKHSLYGIIDRLLSSNTLLDKLWMKYIQPKILLPLFEIGRRIHNYFSK